MGSNVPPQHELAGEFEPRGGWIKDRLTANLVRTIRPMPLEPDCSAMLLDRTPEPELEHDMPSYILMKPGLVSEDESHAPGLDSDDDDEMPEPEDHDSEHLSKGKATKPMLEPERGHPARTPLRRFITEVVRDEWLSSDEDKSLEHLVMSLVTERSSCGVVAEEVISSQAEGASACPEQGEMEDPPVAPDMPELEWADELTPAVLLWCAVVKHYLTMERGARPPNSPTVPVWKGSFGEILACIAKIEKDVRADAAQSAEVLKPFMTFLSNNVKALHQNIFAALENATDCRLNAHSREALFRMALDDVAMRTLGYQSLIRFICEEHDLPTDLSPELEHDMDTGILMKGGLETGGSG